MSERDATSAPDRELVTRDYRLTRRGARLKIETLDYHAEPLWLSADDLAGLGLSFESDARRRPRTGGRTRRRRDNGAQRLLPLDAEP